MERSSSTMSEKGRRQWQRVVELVSRDFTEEELGRLSLATLKALAAHCGLMHPLDIAHLEIAWRSHQPVGKPKATFADAEAQTDPVVISTGLRKADAKTTEKRPTSAVATIKTKETKDSKIATEKPTSPVKERIAKKVDGGDKAEKTKEKVALKEKPASPTKSKAEAPVELPSPPKVEPSPQPEPPAEVKTESKTENKGRKIVSRSASPPVAALEDIRPTFDALVGPSGQMTLTTFLAFMRHEQFLSKHMLPREAEALFHISKQKPTDEGFGYTHFRMRVIPEIASKLRISINDVLKRCEDRGVPEK